MNLKKAGVAAGVSCAIAGLVFSGTREGPSSVVLSGLVTTDDVVVGPQVAGRLVRLAVREGDLVKRGQVLA